MVRLVDAFRELRATWFDCHLWEGPRPGEWETDEQERARLLSNAKLREQYDQQTEAIILGREGFHVAPQSTANLELTSANDYR